MVMPEEYLLPYLDTFLKLITRLPHVHCPMKRHPCLVEAVSHVQHVSHILGERTCSAARATHTLITDRPGTGITLRRGKLGEKYPLFGVTTGFTPAPSTLTVFILGKYNRDSERPKNPFIKLICVQLYSLT